MISVASASPLLSLADPSFARTGPTGDGFAPVLGAVLGGRCVGVAVQPAIGKAMPLPGKPMPDAEVLPDLFGDEAALPPAVEIESAGVGARPPLPLAKVATMVITEAVPPPLIGSSDTPVSRSPAPPPRAAEADQSRTKAAVVADSLVSPVVKRDGAPSPVPPKTAAVAMTGVVSDQPDKANSPPAVVVLQTPPAAPVVGPDAPTAAVTASPMGPTRSPVPPAVLVATIEAPPLRDDRAPRPARFTPPAREATPVIDDAAPPAVAAKDATEKGPKDDEQVMTVEPAPLPSLEQGVVAAAVPPPVPVATTPDPVREYAVAAAPRRAGRVTASPPPLAVSADPVLREMSDSVGGRVTTLSGPAPAAPTTPAMARPGLGSPLPPTLAAVPNEPIPLRHAGEPAVAPPVGFAPERSPPVSSVSAVPLSAAPVADRAVAREPVPVAVPEAAVRVVGGAVLPFPSVSPTVAIRPTAATPAEPSLSVTVEPRPESTPRSPARVAPVEQPRVELAAPVILPALQAFGAQLHRAAAAERRSIPAMDASVLIAPASAPVVVPAEPAPVDVTRPDWPQAMVARIEQLHDRQDDMGSGADTRIRLHPDALGAVEVTVRRDADGTHVRLDAAEPATRALLADAQPRLQALAETRGLRLSGSEVAGGNAQGSTGGWTGNDRRPPAPAPLAPARRHAADTPDDSTDTRLA